MDLETLAQALSGRNGRPKSPEELKRQQVQAFQQALDHALDGTCPGNEDPRHERLDTATVEMLKASVDMAELVPSPVADAIFKLAAHKMTHGGNVVEAFKGLLDGGLADAFLVAGATLRVLEAASKQGVSVTTGNYL